VLRVPVWLTGSDNAPLPAHPPRMGFISRTLASFSNVFSNEFYCERFASKPCFLQSLDPRVKFAVFLLFMIFPSFAKSLPILVCLAAAALVYAKLSGLDMRDYFRRVWCYIPPLIFIFSLPGASSLFTKGAPVFYIIPRGAFGLGEGIFFTSAGLNMALKLALRPGISISFAFLLLLTTRWSRLMSALESFRFPSSAVSVLSMAYRYIFIITSQARNMVEARFLRTVGKLSGQENRRFLSRSAAQLFIRSHTLSEDIYDAMVCRCYSGRSVSFGDSKFGAADLIFVINNLIIFFILIMGEHIF
jgi:cobalt ECF transporter T component CbiQ